MSIQTIAEEVDKALSDVSGVTTSDESSPRRALFARFLFRPLHVLVKHFALQLVLLVRINLGQIVKQGFNT